MAEKEDPIAPDGVDPFELTDQWLAEAHEKEINDPTAMALATADAAGLPDVRMVLLKEVNARGFVFYTNTQSQKGQELSANPQASGVLHWKSIRRQIRFRGAVQSVSDAEADEYFATRPKQSQIGAWASDQSRPLDGKFELEARVAKFAAKYGLGKVPRPPHWSGYRIKPTYIEFWKDGAFRLHDRMIFERSAADAEIDKTSWIVKRLYP